MRYNSRYSSVKFDRFWSQLELPNCTKGHTLAGRSITDTNLVGCVLNLHTVVSQGFLEREPERLKIRVTQLRLAISEPQGDILQALILLGVAMFITWSTMSDLDMTLKIWLWGSSVFSYLHWGVLLNRLVMLELWRMQSSPSLPSLPVQIWSGVVEPYKV